MAAVLPLSLSEPVSQESWWSEHPAVTLAVAAVLLSVPAMLWLRSAWITWRTADTLRSLRLEGLRDVIAATAWIGVVLVVTLLPNASEAKPALLTAAVMGGAVSATVVQVVVAWA